jgi:hypothetical protein
VQQSLDSYQFGLVTEMLHRERMSPTPLFHATQVASCQTPSLSVRIPSAHMDKLRGQDALIHAVAGPFFGHIFGSEFIAVTGPLLLLV